MIKSPLLDIILVKLTRATTSIAAPGKGSRALTPKLEQQATVSFLNKRLSLWLDPVFRNTTRSTTHAIANAIKLAYQILAPLLGNDCFCLN
jgi:hypothetical protein